MKKSIIANRILKYDLCVGCGLCASVLGKENCDMRLNDNGFYRPSFKTMPPDKTIRNICPGIKVHGDSHQSIWGNIKEVVEGWSKDSVLRHKAASGGIVSSLAIYMLESGQANAVLQVGVCDDSYLYNELKISRSKEDVIRNAQSRYAPALTLVNIKQILDSTTERFVFIGKPCDIAGIRNFVEQYPDYRDRFALFISIFCAGMPSYKASIDAWKKSGRDDDPESMKYRGDGWPGYFRATWKDGQEFKLSYHESWGQILGRQLGYRCKICPDGIGMLADVAVGDSWNTRNGYPDFTESDGRSFVFVRTDRGKEAMNFAKIHGNLEYHELSVDKIKDMQAYQYKRRKLIGWRLIPVWFATFGMIDFKGLGIMKQAKSAGMRNAFSNFAGSFKRIVHIVLEKQSLDITR